MVFMMVVIIGGCGRGGGVDVVGELLTQLLPGG